MSPLGYLNSQTPHQVRGDEEKERECHGEEKFSRQLTGLIKVVLYTVQSEYVGTSAYNLSYFHRKDKDTPILYSFFITSYLLFFD